ncbi:class E sortase [Streptomyces sasae]|uniref:class E sortase n=1 Tax=Streptomyces sasae TaxID=1266772 RepID=UPI0029319514|nr:class E sortase [Streptomyces sasae]
MRRVVGHGDRRWRARRRRVVWTGGELLVTVGVVLMLLVVHQLWWTNREAKQGAERKVEALEREWGDSGGAAGSAGSGGSGGSGSGAKDGSGTTGSSSSGRSSTGRQQTSYTTRVAASQAYAILIIPRLGLRVPIAEGVSKPNVLNHGYVGHYPGTQQPGQAGNFALAGHRNTHGEPFRYLPRLRRKDTVEVETKSATYTYVVDQILPQTSSRDSGVVRAVPRSIVKPSYGYKEPGYYITLTTCTPEFTSRYRMVVWGKLVSMRPRA